MRHFERIGDYHAHWGWLILSAPDRFRPINNEVIDQRKALDDAFDALRGGFRFVEGKVKDERLRRIIREMTEMSYQAYVTGDRKRGAHVLQECAGMVWKRLQLGLTYAAEAEERAFGEVVTFKRS